MTTASSRLEIGVGAFIAMGFACALALAFASTDVSDRLEGGTYAVTARFANTGELKQRAPVKIAGVKVGEVEKIELDAKSFDAVATLRIAHSAGELSTDSSAAIYTSGLLGERYVGITPGGDPESLADGGEIALTQSAIVLEQLIGKYMFGSAGKPGGSSSDSAPATDAAPTTTPEQK